MKGGKSLSAIIGLLLFSYQLLAEENGIVLNGYLQTENYLKLGDDKEFSWHEYKLSLKAQVKSRQKAYFYSEIWLRNFKSPGVGNIIDLTDKNKILPLNIELREAYVDIFDFFFDNLDIRIGKQRIAWGVADKFNPTDNLNPDDFENIWDFGRHLSSDGLKVSYYPKDFTFCLVYIPRFIPAVLPFGDLSVVLLPSVPLPTGYSLRNSTESVVMPKNNLKENSIAGVKVSKNLLGLDFSLSYVYGREDLPVVKKIKFATVANTNQVDITTELIYPRVHIVGLDMAGAIAKVGFWVEAAVFFPQRIIKQIDLSALGRGVKEEIALDNYVKYVFGADYTFKNGIYINGQYIHGFVHERGKGNLKDYFVFAMECRVFDKKFRMIPIAGGIEIKDYSFVFSPQITYYPTDDTEMTVGLRFIDGKPTTTFGKLKDKDEIFFKFNFCF